MFINFEEWQDLKKSIDDLFWDNDRMSSGGRYTLNHINNIINRIDKNKNNKFYVVIENDVINDESYNDVIGITLSRKHARKLLKQNVDKLKKLINYENLNVKNVNNDDLEDYDGEWLLDKDNDSFLLYLNGEYNSDHYNISIREVELIYEKDKNSAKEMR